MRAVKQGENGMERIEGRTAFVTGAAGGIGLGIAEALIATGAKVVLADLDQREVERQAERLGSSAAPFVFDVTDRAAWREAQVFAERWGGPVDILVNNAGVGPDMQPLADMAPENFDCLLRIKLNGSFNGVHTFAPSMRERGIGHVVNTASMAGLTITARLGAYTTAMFGLVGMSEVLRAELAPYGVGVSVLCPGRVASRLADTTRVITGVALPTAETPSRVPMPASSSLRVLEPGVVGQMVVEAVRADELYILTHGEYAELVEARGARLIEAFSRVPRHG
jgi:NAD(P)-dependent dehydrogenase (short-subunit alcohol dehydrogenase family)